PPLQLRRPAEHPRRPRTRQGRPQLVARRARRPGGRDHGRRLPQRAERQARDDLPVIKRISLVRRKEGMSREEFLAHWMGPHAEIVRRLPGLRGLRFGVVQRWSPEEAAWDGVGELWFDSIEAADAAFASEPART